MRDLAAGPRRFVELQRVLPGISTEQLRSRLNRMVADGLLTRQRYREVPPRVDYELTARSRELLPVLGALARWGYRLGVDGAARRRGDRHRRDPALRPRPDQRAGRRVAASPSSPCSARTAPRALHDDRRPRRGHDRRAPAPDADVRISGSERDWIDALGPDADRDQLAISGDERLARVVLDGVGATAVRATRAA